MYTDKIIICKDCGAEFVFSAQEQELFATRGLKNEPKRCYACREALKQANKAAAAEAREAGVVCAICGGDVTAQFRSTPRKVVYCRKCYAKIGKVMERKVV